MGIHWTQMSSYSSHMAIRVLYGLCMGILAEGAVDNISCTANDCMQVTANHIADLYKQMRYIKQLLLAKPTALFIEHTKSCTCVYNNLSMHKPTTLSTCHMKHIIQDPYSRMRPIQSPRRSHLMPVKTAGRDMWVNTNLSLHKQIHIVCRLSRTKPS